MYPGVKAPRGFSSRNASCGSSSAGSNFRREPCAEECWRFPVALPGYPGSTPVLCIRYHCRCSWEHPHSGRKCRWSGSGGRRSGSRSSNFFGNDFSYSHHPIWIGASLGGERSPYCMRHGSSASLVRFDRRQGNMILFLHTAFWQISPGLPGKGVQTT